MSLSRLSAGSGYRYLLRHTACGDACREIGTSLTAYYAASGYPAGRWFGSGLAGLNHGNGIAPYTPVTEPAMAALYGSGHDPVTDEPLGSAYPAYRSVEDRIADAIAELPHDLLPAELEARRTEIERVERARPVRVAVAGFDLTFTMPKSASVLWALGNPTVQHAVAEAHRATVEATLAELERRFLHTRVGPQGCAQVPTRGMIAAAFDHWDTRTGDPNLHTHVVIANKVQGPDGVWRSLDSRALHHAAVALSEIYDDLLADALSARLPVQWSWRDRGERRTPAFEIDGLDDELLAAFSGRSAQIRTHVQDLIAEFVERHGRQPSRREVLRLRQQATLATRPEKTVVPLADLFTRWRSTAQHVTGRDPARILQDVFTRPTAAARADADPRKLADEVLHAVAERRSTWTRPNLLAETARATRDLRTTSPAERMELLDRTVQACLDRCVPLEPPDLFPTPARFRRADGTSTFTRSDEHPFTIPDVLRAEDRLLAATEDLAAPQVPATTVEPVLAAAAKGLPGARGLTPDQVAAVRSIATSGRRLDVLLGPAGAGKTRALRALRAAWENEHGQGSARGLAPSATAAAELGAALRVPCETTAKWIYAHSAEDPLWALRPGHLLVVDEASMAATADLDRIVAAAQHAGAKVVLVGDHHQLGAVAAGGAFGLLAKRPHAVTLTALWRFQHRWEADASRQLRRGDPGVLDVYAEHGRIHDGPAELMLDAAYTAWANDVAAGRSALLLAADRVTVAALNDRVHRDRLAAGSVQDEAVVLADDSAAGPGDWVVTRRNDRRLTHSGGHVRNGELWNITEVHPDGSIDVQALRAAAHPDVVHLPADYVRLHVELGYAATVHRAQGMTVDHGHVLTGEGMTRQSLYVAMTRGRESNRVYVATDAPATDCPPGGYSEVPNGRQILQNVLTTDGAELSATATLRQRQDEATSLRRLLPIRRMLNAAARDPSTAAARTEVDSLIRARAAHPRPSASSRQRPSQRGIRR